MLVELQEEEINKVINLINIANKAVGLSIAKDCIELAVKLETAKQSKVTSQPPLTVVPNESV